MANQMEEQIGDVDINDSEMVFDNLTILKEFSDIVNLVKDEEFLELVPKGKVRRVKWVPIFNFLKQGILDSMVQELNDMWKFENMLQKLEILEKQKEKFSDANLDEPLWRPQLGDVKAQLKASDVVNLKKQKDLLESLAKEYESRVNRLKTNVSAKRGYLKVLQMDLSKYQKKNEEIISQLSSRIANHERLVHIRLDNEELQCPSKDLKPHEKWSDEDIHPLNKTGYYLNKFIFQKIVHT